MAQTTVNSYYSTRKRLENNIKNIEETSQRKNADGIEEGFISKTKKTVINDKLTSHDREKDCESISKETVSSDRTVKKVRVKRPPKTKKAPKSRKNEKKASDPKQTVVTTFYAPCSAIEVKESHNQIAELEHTVLKTSCSITSCFTSKTVRDSHSKYEAAERDTEEVTTQKDLCGSPNRSLPLREGSPTKNFSDKSETVVSSTDATTNDTINVRKNFQFVSDSVITEEVTFKKDLCGSPKRSLPPLREGTPTKKLLLFSDKHETVVSSTIATSNDTIKARKKLQLVSHSDMLKQKKGNRKVKAIPQSKSDFDNPQVEKWKETLESFTEKASKLREYHLNSSKITSVISPSKTTGITCALSNKPAHERFRSLVEPDTSTLILPHKYKLLNEMFRCLDTVISILCNRKETTAYEKVQDGVQKMMKKNFTKTHLGQIITIDPSAFVLTLEKCNFISKSIHSPDYMLIITPNIVMDGVSSKKSKAISMSPQCILERRNNFSNSLLDIVKKHHQHFLKSINFPLVPESSIKRWHPKFVVDLLPDIQPAKLPEVPGIKICTAKDVLNKVRGTLRGKVEKALQSVVDEPSTSNVTLELTRTPNTPKVPPTKSALKGVCSDLLEKIRARESAKLLETMTRGPDEIKRFAMMERIPKIVHILWHYFIAERKAAVPIDTAVEKIIHSFNSLTTPDDVKDHLNLIKTTFPGWLSFIEIRKGVYITMDKKRNINEMLDNFKH